MTLRLSRRRVLQYGALGTSMVGLAGCSSITESRRVRSSYTPTMVEPDDTVITDGPTLEEGPPFFATLLTTRRAEREQLNPAVLPDGTRGQWTDIDYETFFVTVVISRVDMTEAELTRTTLDGETYIARFESDDWPAMADEELFTLMEKWQLNGERPPEHAVVRVNFG